MRLQFRFPHNRLPHRTQGIMDHSIHYALLVKIAIMVKYKHVV